MGVRKAAAEALKELLTPLECRADGGTGADRLFKLREIRTSYPRTGDLLKPCAAISVIDVDEDDYEPSLDDESIDDALKLGLVSLEVNGAFQLNFWGADDVEREAWAAALPSAFRGDTDGCGRSALVPMPEKALPPAFRKHASRYLVRLTLLKSPEDVDDVYAVESDRFESIARVAFDALQVTAVDAQRMNVVFGGRGLTSATESKSGDVAEDV